ncbi:MAG: metalloregulator ArsR/SmtB family transcription factor [Rhizobiales bacterium]|nr:metalloregulator ArsR/SmtB family transcription factor [Hyphomicrobiales bacterium]NRB14014.1 metalloregulator ArsR/SmtB family transcription factor [Hyphomicrobiales bacterium]
MEQTLAELRAIAEETRLRIILLLARGELNVKDLTNILGQSQPRVSRHLKLLLDASLINRHREGSWVYFRLSEKARNQSFVASVIQSVEATDKILKRDLTRLEAVKLARSEEAAIYFASIAENWDSLRNLKISEGKVETAIGEILPAELGDLLDLGTGTGRMLELFSNRATHSVGVDMSHEMLSYARLKIEKAGLTNSQVRQGDIFNLPMESERFDTVIIHQVLHFLDESLSVLKEAVRVMRPKAKLMVADLASHGHEDLRQTHSHRRLGYSTEQMVEWGELAGLKLIQSKNIEPSGRMLNEADGQLSVSLWLFERI